MSVDARQELDLKIGVAFSRLMTRAYLEQVDRKIVGCIDFFLNDERKFIGISFKEEFE